MLLTHAIGLLTAALVLWNTWLHGKQVKEISNLKESVAEVKKQTNGLVGALVEAGFQRGLATPHARSPKKKVAARR
jgi:hypothetical protein